MTNLETGGVSLDESAFKEGFNVRTMLGVFFVGLIMVPGSLYLNLVAGASLGGAAEWVTIILFVEVARRSFTTLKRQEIYLLYYVAASLMVAGGAGIGLGPLWRQYLVRSSAAQDFGVAHLIPRWVVPAADSAAIVGRNLFHPDWLPALGLLVMGVIISRVSWFSMAYFLFRVTSDVERLPFPLAPIAAEGATALAESSSGAETWRWRVFSIGAVVGILFALIYIGVPTFTGAFFNNPVTILPIPWVDLTPMTERILPATAIGFTVSLGVIIAGFVLPFWVVVGAFLGALVSIIANPILHGVGLLPSWHPGMDTIQIMFVNGVDFWLSFGMGTTFAVAIVGIVQTVRALRKAGWVKKGGLSPIAPPKGRGDFPIPIAVSAYILVTAISIYVCRMLVPGFPIFFFIFFGFVFTPIDSYISARMIGIAGQFVGIPFVREGTFLLSGYRGAAIWFAPIPMANYGGYVQRFREIELTRTRFTSIMKAEVFMIPIVLGFSLLFWSLIWKLGPIPSPAYPFAQKMWRLQALNRCLWISGTVSAGSWVCDAEGKIRVFDRGEWVPPPEGCPEPCYDVADGGMGDRWVASDRGLYRYQGGQWTRLGPEDEITALAVDVAGRVWAATQEGVLWASRDTWHTHDPPPGGFREPVRKILVDRDGSAWFVSDPGILRYDGVAWTRFTEENGLLENHVNDVAVDREGNLWFLFESGIQRFDGRAWFVPEGSEILAGAGAQCISIDAMDGKWIGSGDRILRHGAVWEEEPMPDLPGGTRIVSVGTVNNDLWFATETDLWRQSSGSWEDLSALEGAPATPPRGTDVRAGKRFLLEALKPPIILAGLGVGLLGLVVLSVLGLPATVVYGFIRSMGQIPHMILPEILGALLGRYYMAKKFGPENWRKYTPVLAAGFSCGMGLVGMAAVAIVLAAKSVIPSVF